MSTLVQGAKSVTLPAGRYVVGDPCYHVPDGEWNAVLEQSDFFEGQCWANFKTGAGLIGTVVAFGTAYGDGVYEDAAGREYGVDAGLIGVIPLHDVGAALDLSCAHVIEFSAPFTCQSVDGVIIFGFVEINTEDTSADDFDALED